MKTDYIWRNLQMSALAAGLASACFSTATAAPVPAGDDDLVVVPLLDLDAARAEMAELSKLGANTSADDSNEEPLASAVPISESQSVTLPADSLNNAQSPEALSPEASPPTSVTVSDIVNNESIELIRQRDEQGHIRVERQVAQDQDGNYINHGSYTEFNASGKVVRKGHYVAGKMSGTWAQEINAAQLRQLIDTTTTGFTAPFTSTASHENGDLNAEWSCRDAGGKTIFSWQFKAGQRDGTSRWYDASGNVIREIIYRANVPHGFAKLVEENSTEPSTIEFVAGGVRRSQIEYFPGSKSQKKSERNIIASIGQSLTRHSWLETKVEFTSQADRQPILDGPAINWHMNGQVAMEGNYAMDQKSGDFVWYYPNGAIMGKGTFTNDKEDGEWTWWHANGMRKAEGHYVQGKRVGVWSNWNADGRLVFRGDATMLRDEMAGKGSPRPLKR